MTYSLGPLQRTILILALRNREGEGRTAESEGADVYQAEVLVAHFGWETTHDPRSIKGQKFSPKQIGPGAYRAGKVAVSKAITTLEARGLVEARRNYKPQWSGASLTAQGVAVARTLTTDTAALVPDTDAIALAIEGATLLDGVMTLFDLLERDYHIVDQALAHLATMRRLYDVPLTVATIAELRRHGFIE